MRTPNYVEATRARTFLIGAAFLAINQYFGRNQVAADSSPSIHVTNVRLLVGNAVESQFLEITGTGFSALNHMKFRLTDNSTDCDAGQDELEIVKRTDHMILAVLKVQEIIEGWQYLCYEKKPGDWLHHLGAPTKFHRTADSESSFKIYGFRVEASAKETSVSDEGVTSLMGGQKVTLRIFGHGISEDSVIAFTKFTEGDQYSKVCEIMATTSYKVIPGSLRLGSALVNIDVANIDDEFHLCAKQSSGDNFKWTFQGIDPALRIVIHRPLLPMGVQLLIITICLMFSALFSGLNLGLMSLDRTDLKILKNTGSENEKMYARAIQPVRDHGNYLLCSILLGNVLVNSTFTILLDGLTSGLMAVVFSTLLIVIFGEITPQAICSRHGLAVGAKTIWITKAVMAITFPLAYPTSLILDKILGEEIGNFYNRERLKELVKVTTDVNDLDKDEVNIISGVLELRKKKVSDAMTHIEDAFMLSIDTILDFETVSEIMKSGFSRIPVYEDEKTNIVALMYIKDLAFVDPDDNTPLKTLCEFYQNQCHFVFDDLTLDVMFKQFKEGNKGHMAFVHRVNNEGDGDPFYETIGLITMEDVIEELIQAEIMDETDVFTDNRKKVRRKRTKEHDFTVFVERKDYQRIRISPQLTLATFQYLSTSLEAFKSDQVSETILRRLLNQDIVRHVKHKGKDKNDPSLFIFSKGKPVDYFVLILEGRVEVQIGREEFTFESGPFTYFGIQAVTPALGTVESPQQIRGSLQSINIDTIIKNTFVPDYSVKAVTETVYLEIKKQLYLAAKRATLMERQARLGEPNTEAMDDEVEKLLHSLNEGDYSVHNSVPNLNGGTPKTMSKPSSHAPSPTAMIHDNSHTNGPPLSVSPNSVSFQIGNRSNSVQARDANTTGGSGGNHDDSLDSHAPLLPRSKS